MKKQIQAQAQAQAMAMVLAEAGKTRHAAPAARPTARSYNPRWRTDAINCIGYALVTTYGVVQAWRTSLRQASRMQDNALNTNTPLVIVPMSHKPKLGNVLVIQPDALDWATCLPMPYTDAGYAEAVLDRASLRAASGGADALFDLAAVVATGSLVCQDGTVCEEAREMQARRVRGVECVAWQWLQSGNVA